MGADVVIVHPESPALRELSAALAGRGHQVQERAVAVGAAAFVLRAKPHLAIVHAGMPLVPGEQVIRSISAADPTRATRLLLYAEQDSADLKRGAAGAGADDRVHGDGVELLKSIARWLPGARRPSSASGTRQRSIEGYVLVACDPSTSARLTFLAEDVHRHTTDSGTEALRLICSPTPPRLALLGTSLSDLPCLTVLRTALKVDPSWRDRIVLLAEHAVASVPPEIELAGARVWSDREPPQGLAALVDRLRRAS